MKKDRLYTDLKRQILTMELEPGTPLDETRISEAYQISRTPLRDVFRRLAGEGYLVIVNNRGASVSPMNHKTLRSFFMTAPMIYAAIGRLAADNATPEQIVALKNAQKEFRSALEKQDGETMVFWNDCFHSLMGDMADNIFLQPSYERLLIDHARISQTFYRPGKRDLQQKMQEAAEHHDAMIDCIAKHDTEGMAALTHQHWALSRAQMEQFVRPDPLPVD